MALSITNESKNTASSLTAESKNALSITNEGNPHASNLTIDDATWAIDDAEGTIDAPHIKLTNESKN